MNDKYAQYLLSPEWQKKRIECFSRVGNRCEACGDRGDLQCHHLTYARIFNEHPDDLMALCEPHHQAIESLYKDGVILKYGDPILLRKQTIQLLTGRKAPPTTQQIEQPYFVETNTEKLKPKEIQASLMLDQVFVKALSLSTKEFRRWNRKYFKAHKERNRMVANAHVVFQMHKKGESPKPILLELPKVPPPKPISDNEIGANMAKDIDQLERKYSSKHRQIFIRELLKKAQSMI